LTIVIFFTKKKKRMKGAICFCGKPAIATVRVLNAHRFKTVDDYYQGRLTIQTNDKYMFEPVCEMHLQYYQKHRTLGPGEEVVSRSL
jgi:thymidine kinase